MDPHSPAQKLLAAIEVATTEWQFAIALADYRAPRRVRRDGRIQRVPRNKDMPSLRELELEPYRELPGRNNICKWENGDKSVGFEESQLRAYLSLCKITGELFEACIEHYRRIEQQGTNGGQDAKESFAQQDTLDISGIDLDPANFQSYEDLAHCLEQLYTKNGRIPYYELSDRIGGKLPFTSIADLIGGKSKIITSASRLAWKTVEIFVLACGVPEADLKKWRKAWEASVTVPRRVLPKMTVSDTMYVASENDAVYKIYVGILSYLQFGLPLGVNFWPPPETEYMLSMLWPGKDRFESANEFTKLVQRAAMSIGGETGNAIGILLGFASGFPVMLNKRESAVMKFLDVEPSLYLDKRQELLYELAAEIHRIYIEDAS